MESMNSGKKITYLNEVGEFLANGKKNTKKAIDAVYDVACEAKIACADKAYNALAEVAIAQLEVIATGGKGLLEMAEALSSSQSKQVGEALTLGAKKVTEEYATLGSNNVDVEKFSESTISGRGLEENWTEAMQAKFDDACRAFIQVRVNLLRDIAESTAKAREGDFDDIYKSYGRNLEEACNEIASIFRKHTEAFEKAGVDINKMQEQARQSTSGVGKVDFTAASAPMDV